MIKNLTSVILIVATTILLIFIYQINPSTSYYYEVFKHQKGYGYNILLKGKIIIHQEVVPAITEQKGFPSDETAKKCAKIIILKLKKKKPPVVTMFEIKKLLEDNNGFEKGRNAGNKAATWIYKSE